MAERAERRPPAVPATRWLRTLPPAVRFAFNGDAAARAAARAAWGCSFSEQACRAVTEHGRATLWLGPDEYLLIGQPGAGEPAEVLFAPLETAIGAVPHSLVDVSHRQFALEISGPKAEVILNGACPLDLDLVAFPVGMCTRTVLAKADIVLWRIREDAFHVELWRSFAGYVSGVLGEIAAEFYSGRQD